MDAEKEIIKARIRLLLTKPFFGSIVMGLKLVKDDELTRTWSTDGRNLYYNENFTKKMAERNPAYLDFLLCHEVLHCAAGHLWRMGERHQFIWNIATDLAINWLLRQNGFMLPEGALLDKNFADMDAEAIYSKLMQKCKKISDENGNINMPVQTSDGKTSSPQTIDDHKQWEKAKGSPEDEQKWKQIVANAANAARQQGNIPAGFERFVEEVLNPKVNYKHALAKFLSKSRSNYSFDPPDRRYLTGSPDDIFIPNLNDDEELLRVVFAIDTSGSITDREIGETIASLNHITRLFHVQGWLMFCDAEVHGVYEVNGQMPKFEVRGGGGTDFRPVFEKIKEMKIRPALLLYFTDTYGVFPKQAPDYPVMWAVHDTGNMENIPFGMVVRM